MLIVDRKQFWSGLLFCLIGVGTLYKLPTDLGTASAMGPGYFPMLLGIVLVMLGTASVVAAMRHHDLVRIEPVPIVASLFILAGVVAFALLVKPFGLAIALAALIGLGCYDRVLGRPLVVLAIYGPLLLLTWFVFIYIIQLPIALGWQ